MEKKGEYSAMQKTLKQFMSMQMDLLTLRAHPLNAYLDEILTCFDKSAGLRCLLSVNYKKSVFFFISEVL